MNSEIMTDLHDSTYKQLFTDTGGSYYCITPPHMTVLSALFCIHELKYSPDWVTAL